MSDDLVFPPNDAFSFMQELGQLQDPNADINPAFPMPEQLNIPELVPPIASSLLEDRTNEDLTTIYTPMSQLMKQTEQLVNQVETNKHIYSPTTVEPSNFVKGLQNIINKNTVKPLSFSIDTASSPVAQNSQCLVMGNQRIQIPMQNAGPLNSPSELLYTSKSSPVEMQNNVGLPQHSNNNQKQPLVLKLPPGVQSNKAPLKGQIVKTADQRLMFVTEMNGKRVGYLIQQSKQSTPQQLSPQSTQPIVSPLTSNVDQLITVEKTNTPMFVDGSSVDSVIDRLNTNAIPTNSQAVTRENLTAALRQKLLSIRNQTKVNTQPNELSRSESNAEPILPTAPYIKETRGEENNCNLFDEEGQEIEFSETDLTFEEDGRKNEISDKNITDDEDTLPLAKLKVEDDIEPPVKSKRGRKPGSKNKDLMPLSLVAAKLKKGIDGKKGGKTRGRNKKKKDAREPVKPIRAYQMFFRDVQTETKKQNPDVQFGEMSKMVAHMWETLNEEKKKEYQDLHYKEKEEYLRKMEEYKQILLQDEENPPTDTPGDTPGETLRPLKRGAKRKAVKKLSQQQLDEMEEDAGKLVDDPNFDLEQIEKEVESGESDYDPNYTSQLKQLKKKRHMKARLEDGGSSPSLPSSSESSEDEDHQIAISRIRQKAAELKEKIYKEKLAVLKSKRKTPMEIDRLPLERAGNEVAVEKTLLASPVATKSTFKIPKKSNTDPNAPATQGPRICLHVPCNTPAKISRERGSQYCSNACLVLYCRDVFDSWVRDREIEHSS